MTILNQYSEPDVILALWVMSLVGILIRFSFHVYVETIEHWWTYIIYTIGVGICIAFICFTPVHHYVQVYADNNLKIESVIENYNIVDTNGLIITLEQK